jgi:hypothetical protein
VVAHFCVSDLSVELLSQSKPVAEVQVTDMKAGVTRRPYDTNLAMSAHSLLLVDALQAFGPDYELLVASHKHVTVDSVSGSLRGSDPASQLYQALQARLLFISLCLGWIHNHMPMLPSQILYSVPHKPHACSVWLCLKFISSQRLSLMFRYDPTLTSQLLMYQSIV